MNELIRFGKVLETVAVALSGLDIPWERTVVVRDIYGRILVLFDFDEEEKGEQSGFLNNVEDKLHSLGPYANEPGSVLCKSDLYLPEDFFSDPDILEIVLPGDETVSLRLLERQIVGQDWLRPKPEQQNTIPRLAFYGFKGGVGRSTTVAAVAFLLAREGKKVLVLDFDLESPGLSSMLLPNERYPHPQYGIVDWLVEDAVGNVDDLLLRDAVAASPLARDFDGDIKVVPAMGAKTTDPQFDPEYISKLSRVYADIPREEGCAECFSDRLERFIQEMEAQEQPDVVLLDCRAGLHDLSAGSIVRIANESFLFVIDTPQSWEGYRMLFSHWSRSPKLLAKIRDRLNIVHALIPTGDRDERRKMFRERSYLLFADTIYEQSDPSEFDLEAEALFNFDIDAEDSPHYPVDVFWSSVFSEFSYRSLEDKPTQEIVELTYSPIMQQVRQIMEGYVNAK